jgi:hypothetical protein
MRAARKLTRAAHRPQAALAAVTDFSAAATVCDNNDVENSRHLRWN